MFKYAVNNTREESVTVDGLGVIPPQTTCYFDETAAEAFKFVRGLSIVQAAVPEGVEVSVCIGTEPATENFIDEHDEAAIEAHEDTSGGDE